MRLVLQYSVCDYEYYATETFPVEYESEEALICDFEEALDQAIEKKEASFIFIGFQFITSIFYTWDSHKTLPDIMTLDHWFELNKKF